MVEGVIKFQNCIEQASVKLQKRGNLTSGDRLRVENFLDLGSIVRDTQRKVDLSRGTVQRFYKERDRICSLLLEISPANVYRSLKQNILS